MSPNLNLKRTLRKSELRELRDVLLRIDRELIALKDERAALAESDFTFWQWLRWGCARVLVPIIVSMIALYAVRASPVGNAIAHYVGMP